MPQLREWVRRTVKPGPLPRLGYLQQGIEAGGGNHVDSWQHGHWEWWSCLLPVAWHTS